MSDIDGNAARVAGASGRASDQTLKSDGGWKIGRPRRAQFLAKEFVEFVVRSDPGPLDRITHAVCRPREHLGLLSPTNNLGSGGK